MPLGTNPGALCNYNISSLAIFLSLIDVWTDMREG